MPLTRKLNFKFNLWILGCVSLLVLLVLFVSDKGKYLVTAASPFVTAIEAENATHSGPIKTGLDSNASAGMFAQYGTPVSSTAFQPTSPYYATFFYVWYQNPNTDAGWSYWHDNGGNPPNTWFSHYMPDPNPSAFDPANELYSSSNYNNFKWQVSKMAEAHIEVAIDSWWGQGGKEDNAFNNIINSFMARPDNPYPNLRFAMYYENEGFGDPTVAQIVSDLNYIKTKYVNSPYMLKIGGKPVMFVYAGANDVPGTMTQRWHDANAQVGNSFYIVLKVFPGYATDPNQPDAWHQYSPAVRTAIHAPDAAYVSPGFWLDDGVSPERLVRNPTDFETAVKGMVSANVKWKLIETWNEWGEGTAVEPGIQVRTNPTTGKDEPDPNGYPFQNLYIDILNRNLPPLEQGTGFGTLTAQASPSPTAPSPTPTSQPTPSASPVASPSSITAGTDPVIASVGDIACGSGSTGAACTQMATSNLLATIKPNAVLPLGDNQYESGTLADFQNFYQPSWGRYKSITFPAVGNHEYLTANAQGYFDYFNGVGNQTGPAGDRSKGYYAFNVGSWRLYALNSNCSAAGGCGAGSPQETWLRSDLAANPHQCVLAYFHHPLYTSGTRATPAVKPLYQALYDNNADLILNGHEHNYERFAPQDANAKLDLQRGIREIVVGTGGRNFTQEGTPAANSEIRNDTTYGVLKVVLHPTSYDLAFVPIAGSTFTDSITNQACH